jgi:hypothetical protein
VPDYQEGINRGGGLICTPAGIVRNDAGGDLAGGNLKVVEQQADSAGATRVNPEGQKQTYIMSFVNAALAATPTDVLCLIGSATFTFKITRIELAFSCATGTTTIADVIANIRTTLDTGGTLGAAPAISPVDQNDPGGTSGSSPGSARYYSANPGALGTLGCILRAQKLAVISPAVNVPASDSVIWTFGTEPGSKCPSLRGITQSLCINFNGSAVGTTPTLSGTIEFTAEPITA